MIPLLQELVDQVNVEITRIGHHGVRRPRSWNKFLTPRRVIILHRLRKKNDGDRTWSKNFFETCWGLQLKNRAVQIKKTSDSGFHYGRIDKNRNYFETKIALLSTIFYCSLTFLRILFIKYTRRWHHVKSFATVFSRALKEKYVLSTNWCPLYRHLNCIETQNLLSLCKKNLFLAKTIWKIIRYCPLYLRTLELPGAQDGAGFFYDIDLLCAWNNRIFLGLVYRTRQHWRFFELLWDQGHCEEIQNIALYLKIGRWRQIVVLNFVCCASIWNNAQLFNTIWVRES